MITTHQNKFLLGLLLWTFLIYLFFGAFITVKPNISLGYSNFWEHYEGDRYRAAAEALVEGRPFLEPINAMPLYPMLLAGLLKLFGYASLPVLLLHVCAGVLVVFLTYKIGDRLFSPAVGLLAAFLMSVHPLFVKLTMQIIETGPSVALTTLAMWLLLKAWFNSPANMWQYALAGLVFGVATLMRPTAGIYMVIIGGGLLFWFIIRRRPVEGLLAISLMGLIWAVVMMPWWLRNYTRYGYFIPFTTWGGLAMAVAHQDNFTDVAPWYDYDLLPEAYPDQPDVGNDPSGYKRDKLYRQMAIDYIKANPVQAFTADLQKVVWQYTWHKVPPTLIDSQARWDPVLQKVVEEGPNPRLSSQDIIYAIYWTPILLLFLFGLVLSWRYWEKLLPIYLIILANAFTAALGAPSSRYRLEVEPYVLILAMFGLLTLVAKFGPKSLINRLSLTPVSNP